MKISLLIILFTFSCVSYGQEEVQIEKFESELERVNSDTAKIRLYHLLINQLKNSDIERSQFYENKAYELAERSSSQAVIVRAAIIKASSLSRIGEYSKAIVTAQKGLDLMRADSIQFEKNSEIENDLMAQLYNQIGQGYDYRSYYDDALKYYLKSLSIYQFLEREDRIATVLNNLAIAYMYMGDLDNSEKYFNKSFDKYILIDSSNAYQIKMNLGIIEASRGNKEGALSIYRECLDLFKRYGNLQSQGYAVSNIGDIYRSTQKNDSALIYLEQGVAIDLELGNIEGAAIDYGIMGAIYIQENKYDLAEKYLSMQLEIGRDLDRKFTIQEAYKVFTRLEKARNRPAKALEYFELYTVYKDSIRLESNSKAIGKIEAESEFNQKLAVQNATNDKLLEIEEGKRARQSIITYFTIGVLVVILFFVYFLFKSLRKTKEQKKLVDQAKLEIEEKNTELTDSIKYAQRIQLALLKEDEEEVAVLPPHFILFKPKDIVSGDFYWSYHIEDFWYIAAADCTGHGVPGAMLTMLGTAYLNEICVGGVVLKPGEILDRLKSKITKELSQKGLKGESKDGMDMSLLRMNLKTKEVQWAGANNPLYQISSGALTETKADKQPIGYSDNVTPFTNHTVELKEGDSIYLFTDGYADQFGGPKGKKFKYSNFKKLLVETDLENATNQHDKLDKTIETWKGELEQLDDICIIGIRF